MNVPECPNHGPVLEIEDIGCPYCDSIRKAYWLGHHDATQLYKYLMDHHLGRNKLRIFDINTK